MPYGMKPICSSCKVNNSTIWKKLGNGEILCNQCVLKNNGNGSNGKESQNNGGLVLMSKSNGGLLSGPVLRKSSRIKPSKHKQQTSSKSVATKGKSRRIIFKKSQPVKAPTAVSTVVTGESVFHDEGDIVSLVDHDGSVYYAQIRGFLKDQYNDKSAVLSWLLPTQSSPRDRFDPATYMLGPEEDLPRRLEFMEFVCHAPSDYFKCQYGPYPTISRDPELCYIWGSVKQPIQLVPPIEEVFENKDIPKETIKKLGKESTAKLTKENTTKISKDISAKVPKDNSTKITKDTQTMIKKEKPEKMDIS